MFLKEYQEAEAREKWTCESPKSGNSSAALRPIARKNGLILKKNLSAWMTSPMPVQIAEVPTLAMKVLRKR